MSLRSFALPALLALTSALSLTACFDSNTVECSGGVVCPAGSTCTADGLGCVSTTGCGDGVVAGVEECDDGNQVDTDDCKADCTLNICGDGSLDTQGDRTDTCDDDNFSNDDDCVEVEVGGVPGQCRPSSCGDGHTDSQAPGIEMCDDGDNESNDGCRADCGSNETCRNGVLDDHLPGAVGCLTATTLGTNCPEVCEDDDAIAGDGCSPNCLSDERCGNGILDEQGGPFNPPEQCDDGNMIDDDDCRNDCQGNSECGNDLIDIGEQCDMGSPIQDTLNCDSDCSAPDCGDNHHNMAAGEDCDPGAGTVGGSTAGCNYDCSIPACGDGIINRAFTPMNGTVPEQCDDGGTEPGDGCSATCQIETCGNGVTEMINGEQCDDGNSNDLDSCRNNCQSPRCGDGIASTPPIEICDTNGDSQTCDADCSAPVCGDNRVNPMFTPPGGTMPESCDDGNTTPGDGCSELCRIESCGNGIEETINGEQCDDGNTDDTDACRNNCQDAVCGDGVTHAGFETCDTAGNTVMCDSDCTMPQCGDGIVNSQTQPLAEQCEDGNLNNGDGCSSTCRLEPFQVTVVKAGTGGGTVTSDPVGIDCGNDCTELYLVGTVVELTAVPDANATFVGWSGEGCTGAGTCQLTMNSAKTVTATFRANTLTVVRDGTGGGTVTSSSPAGAINCGSDCTETVNTGTTVTLVATADSTSQFTTWTGGGCGTTSPCTVTMNEATDVTATFTLRNFTLTLTKGGTGTGTVTSGPVGIDCDAGCTSDQADFLANTMVTLSAAPSADSLFAGWSGACAGTGQCSVTMSQARSVTATFDPKPFTVTVTRSGSSGTISSSPPGINCTTTGGGSSCNETYLAGTSVTLTATPGSENAFIEWSGGPCSGSVNMCTFTVVSNVTINATFDDNDLTVVRTGNGGGTVTSSPGGINCGGDCVEDYDAGTDVTLTATANSTSRFTGWVGGGCGTTSPCIVDLVLPTTVEANFVDTYVLTLNKTGDGTGTVTSDPAGINCGTGCSSANATYDDDTVVTLTAVAGPSSVFSGWSGAGCSGTGTCQVTMSQARTVTADFDETFTLSVMKLGGGSSLGTVQSSPGGIDCGLDCTEDYVDGTDVTLSASTTGGATFNSWSGAPGCNTNPICVVDMTQARNVTATFDPPVLFTLDVTLAGSGAANGSVTSDPVGITCAGDCSEMYLEDTVVTLTAAVTGSTTFTGWSGDTACGMTNPCMVTMDAAKSVTATFALPTFQLDVTVDGTGAAFGTVTSDPAGISCAGDCSESYNEGTMVELTAATSGGATFTSWSGAAGCTTSPTCIVTMDAAHSVTATFAAPTFQLDVTLAGTGAAFGSVTSDPVGITCAGDCSETYDLNTMVELTAAVSGGATFTGWSGDTACGMTNPCMVTMDAAKSVTATFAEPTFQLDVTVVGPASSGSVMSMDAGINCPGDCNEVYPNNTMVTLTAIEEAGHDFDGWTGDGCSGTMVMCTVTMDQARSVTATFIAEPPP